MIMNNLLSLVFVFTFISINWIGFVKGWRFTYALVAGFICAMVAFFVGAYLFNIPF